MRNLIIDSLSPIKERININHIGGYEGIYIVECSVIDCDDDIRRLMHNAVDLLRPLILGGKYEYGMDNRTFFVVFKGKDIKNEHN